MAHNPAMTEEQLAQAKAAERQILTYFQDLDIDPPIAMTVLSTIFTTIVSLQLRNTPVDRVSARVHELFDGLAETTVQHTIEERDEINRLCDQHDLNCGNKKLH